jgi:hypothetical protein
MQIHSAEEAKKRFDSLPQEIKNVLYSPEMAFAIQQVGQKNHLHLDQIDFLNTETAQVMLGFVDIKDFTAELAESLNIGQFQAEVIAKDIEDSLFSKIRDAMKKVYEAGKTPTPVISSVPPVIPPLPSAPQPPKQLSPLADILPKKSSPAPSAPIPPPAAPPPPPTIAPAPAIPKPPVPLAPIHTADTMLNEKTVQVAPVAQAGAPVPSANGAAASKPQPPKPDSYKKDPYREPIE